MKKLIAIIAISLLAASAASAQNVNTYSDCSAKDNRTTRHTVPKFIIERYSDLPWHLVLDEYTCIPDAEPDKPTIPDVPEVDKPEIDIPEVDVPEVELPDTPETDEPETEIPDTPIAPDEPETDIPEIEAPISSYAQQVLDLVNAERAKVGLNALTYDSQLELAANTRAVEIRTSFSHTRPNGTSCFTTLDEIGYRYGYAGENIAYGQSTPEEVVNAWMNSQGHRENILNANYTHLGVGVYENGATIYWAQMFASK